MFTCPENDLLSVYVDKELPAEFVKEFEDHIASCEKCKLKVQNMQKLHSVLKSDSESLHLDDVFLNQSFERLQSRMRYQKVVSQIKEDSTKPLIMKIIPAAAAAAVFAVMLFVPLQLSASKNTQSSNSLQIVKRQNALPIAQSNVVVDGIPEIALNTLSSSASSNGLVTAVSNNAKSNSTDHLYSTLVSIDIFRPDFQQYTVNVSIPAISDMPTVITEPVTYGLSK